MSEVLAGPFAQQWDRELRKRAKAGGPELCEHQAAVAEWVLSWRPDALLRAVELDYSGVFTDCLVISLPGSCALVELFVDRARCWSHADVLEWWRLYRDDRVLPKDGSLVEWQRLYRDDRDMSVFGRCRPVMGYEDPRLFGIIRATLDGDPGVLEAGITNS